MPKEKDPEFDGAKPIDGLEHLGRAIVDENGQPSGSPANFENTRGKGEPELSPTAYKDVVSAIGKAFPKDE